MDVSPRLRVVIAARNEAACLGDCLDALLIQDLPPGTLEILVVDDASTDETAACAGQRGIACLRLSRSGPALARNLGVQASRTPYVAFVDADAVPARDWAGQLLAALETLDDPSVAGVGGSQAGHPEDGPFARDLDRFLRAIGFVADYAKPQAAPARVGHNASCNSAYKRDIFLRAGGFRPGFFPGEDVDLDRRLAALGHTVWVVPAARIAHRRPGTPRAWLRMLVSYARSQADCVAIHGLFRPLHAVPLAWLGGLVLLLARPGAVLSAGGAAVLVAAIFLRQLRALPLGRAIFFLLTTGLVYPPVFLARLGLRRFGRSEPREPKTLPPLDARPELGTARPQDSGSTSTRAS